MGVYITKLIVKNYRSLKDTTINFNEHLNIIVGDNECGKSSLLEAVNLVLCGQVNGRSIQSELHPFLFNKHIVEEYINVLREGRRAQPPKILIEAYLNDDASLARLKGTINSSRENIPGVSLSIELDESYSEEFSSYLANPEDIRTIPIEYYKVVWQSFANANITSRSIPIWPTLIDASTIRHNTGANKYIVDIMKDYLAPEQRVQLNLSYRKMKDSFLEDDSVKSINNLLLTKKGNISHKDLSISLDTTSKAGWENGIMPHLDDIPLPLIGKGEQNSIKIKLAMEAAQEAHLFLIEEPENHLSYHNLYSLIKKISEQSVGKQLIITTHSSFVLNKLGVENVILFNGARNITLKALKPETYDYFMKLPGHDTLRLILAKKAILVEGPSDELVVHKAFHYMYGINPLEKGVDIITVNSLAFKRFLEIAVLLDIEVSVITDNDGNTDALLAKYVDFFGLDKITICYDTDMEYPTLEPQLLKVNELSVLNKALGKAFENEDDLLDFMSKNKTDCALKIFNSTTIINIPEYINDSIRE